MIKGVRYDSKRYGIGDSLPASRVWVDGEPTDEILPGTSALHPAFDALLEDGRYRAVYKHKYIIEGRYVCDGYDDGELILADCTVAEILG